MGYEFLNRIVGLITETNIENRDEKNVIIGILIEENQLFLDRMVKFLIEAGLLYKTSELHDGPGRVFKRYIPHYLFLLQNRAFHSTKGWNPKDILWNIKKKTNKRPIRKKFSTILDSDLIDKVQLDLPSCSNCGTPRLSDEQKFCHICGTALVGQSNYERCLQIDIGDLAISDWLKNKVKKETVFDKIGDFLSSQSPGSDLKKARGIGEARSNKVLDEVNKILDEFLS